MVEGLKSNFFTDVKTPIYAGMQFTYDKNLTKNHKCKHVGYDLVRIYYDTIEKDCTIGQERIKRTITC